MHLRCAFLGALGLFTVALVGVASCSVANKPSDPADPPVEGCQAGFDDCDGLSGNGCETLLATDAANCGACDHACTANEECADSSCTCPAPFTSCGVSCVDTLSDEQHCGDCTTACGNCQQCNTGHCDAVVVGPPSAIEITGEIAGNGQPCGGGDVTLTVDPVPGGVFTWTLPSGGTLPNQDNSIDITFGSLGGQLCVRYQSPCGPSPSTCMLVSPVTPPPGTADFNFTGAAQAFDVPECLTRLTVETFGAQGGGSACGGMPNQDDGGLGGSARATIDVTPGETLNIFVGAKGSVGPALAAFNGGGPSGQYGGSGGGASDVRRGGSTLANRVVVAGGGGGGNCGSPDQGAGGDGGGLTGNPGISFGTALPGAGGSQVGGGGAGDGSTPGVSGNGGGTGTFHEAGGGGGHFGGGGATQAGGGGGSAFIVAAGSTNTAMSTGVHTGDGLVHLSW